jgi:hypothetical protein
LTHGLNKKWSIYLNGYVSSLFSELGYAVADAAINEFSVSLKLSPKDDDAKSGSK